MKIGFSPGLGVSMLAGSAFMQQAPYDLGEVWKDVDSFTSGAGQTATTAAQSLANGVPLTQEMVYIALALTGIKLIEPTIRKIIEGRVQRKADERQEASADANHRRDMERLRVENELGRNR